MAFAGGYFWEGYAAGYACLYTSGIDRTKCACYNIVISARGGAAVARRAHNPEVAGSNPAPATTTAGWPCTSRKGVGACPAVLRSGSCRRCEFLGGISACPVQGCAGCARRNVTGELRLHGAKRVHGVDGGDLACACTGHAYALP